MTPNFQLILCDHNQALCDEFEDKFESFPEVHIICSSFEHINFDCIVSPANSFGLMDGGMDAAITRYFGKQMMNRVQSHIISKYAGEQPIGTCEIVRATPDNVNPIKYVAHAPTMIVPLHIANTTNVYMAMKSILLSVQEHNNTNETKINNLLCCGLGTGVGHVPYDKAAYDMAKAYRNFKYPLTIINWQIALGRYKNIID